MNRRCCLGIGSDLDGKLWLVRERVSVEVMRSGLSSCSSPSSSGFSRMSMWVSLEKQRMISSCSSMNSTMTMTKKNQRMVKEMVSGSLCDASDGKLVVVGSDHKMERGDGWGLLLGVVREDVRMDDRGDCGGSAGDDDCDVDGNGTSMLAADAIVES
jgi:hypothetical protein